MKSKTMTSSIWAVAVIGIVALLIVGYAGGLFSTSSNGTDIDPNTGELIGKWDGKLVNFDVLTSNKFSGADVNAVLKVYDVQPEDWGNPRGDFSDSSLYTPYTASSGVAEIDKEYAGKYYVVGTLSGSNTEFFTIDITNGVGHSESLADYNAEPDAISVEFSAVGTTTDEDFAFTLTNQTNYELSDTITLRVADDTEFRGWKVIVNDQEGFSIDTDGDGIYDEGIKKYVVDINGKKTTLFEPAKGIDLFDSNDEYTLLIEGTSVADGDDLALRVEITANTGDYVGANDEVWGEGEGVLSYIKVYDQEGNLFATTDVTA